MGVASRRVALVVTSVGRRGSFYAASPGEGLHNTQVLVQNRNEHSPLERSVFILSLCDRAFFSVLWPGIRLRGAGLFCALGCSVVLMRCFPLYS